MSEQKPTPAQLRLLRDVRDRGPLRPYLVGGVSKRLAFTFEHGGEDPKRQLVMRCIRKGWLRFIAAENQVRLSEGGAALLGDDDG